MFTWFFRTSLIVSAFLQLFCISLSGQETAGSIAGVVKDPSGAAIPHAKVTIVSQQQGSSRSLETGGDGNFYIDPLQAGTYRVTVEAAGFKNYLKTSIVLFANQHISLGDITLQVGTQAETVTVEAGSVQLQTEDATRSGLLTGSQTVNLALNGRNYLDLVKTVPGIVSDFDGEVAGPGGIGSIFANGQRGNQNNSTLDGVGNVDTGSNGTQHTSLNIDAVAELSIVTNSESAEFGRSVGASVNVVTKSGTREFHGTGYWFHRNEGLNANSFFNNANDQPRQLYRYNYQGYNIGGPVFIPGHFNKDRQKLFFFFGEEFQRQLVPAGSPVHVTVPTAAQRMGNFAGTQDGSGNPVTITDPLTGQPFPGNVIPASRIDPNGGKILNFYPLPNVSGFPDYNYTTQDSSNYPRRQETYRGDWNISDKWRFFARAIKDTDLQLLPYGLWNASYNIPFTKLAFGQPGYSTIANLTTTIDPTLTNEIVFGLSHNFLSQTLTTDAFALSKLGTTFPLPFPKASPSDLIPNFTFGGVPNGPSTAFEGTPFVNYNTTIEIHDTVSKVVGSHRFKVGAYWQRSAKDQTSTSPASGAIDFGNNPSNPGNTGWAFSNALLGNFNTFQQSSGVLNGQYRYNNVEWFALDSWKITPKLTVEYGIRFYWIQPQYDQALQTSTFNPSLFTSTGTAALYGENAAGQAVNPITGATAPSALIAALVPGTGTLTDGIYTNGIARAGRDYPAGLIDGRGINFGPRLGVAYNIFAKTVIRAGGGVFYDRFQGNPVFAQLTNPPSVQTPEIFFGNIETAASAPGVNFPEGLSAFAKDGHIPTTYNYNFSVQRELPFGLLLDVAYVGSVSNHLLYEENINGSPFGSAFLLQNQDPTKKPLFNGTTTINQNLYRPYPGYSDIDVYSFGANSNYNALQVSLNRRLAKNFQLGVAYTWSKALGVASNDTDVLNPLNYKKADYGPLGFDRTQVAVINYIYNLPSVASHGNVLDNKVGHFVLNNWVVSGITTFSSGEPVNVTYGVAGGLDVNLLTTGSESFGPRPVITGNPYAGAGGFYNYINASVFHPAPVGSVGIDSGQNVLRQPFYENWDISVFKNFPFWREGTLVELRLEAFNAFNHAEFNGYNTSATFSSLAPNATITNLPTALGGGGGPFGFGALNSTRSPRIVQIAAKFYF